MATDKKSFVLYADLLKSIEHLTNEEKGILFNHLLEYVNDKNPVLTDRLVLTAWKPIELQLKRDLKKFEEVKVKRSDAGKRSAELRALKSNEQKATKPTSVESVQQTSTNPTVNDNVNVNDTVINKSKGKKFSPPTLLEVEIYFLENTYSKELAKKAFNYYDIAQWKDARGNQVKNWKQKMQSVWFKEENKTSNNKNNNNHKPLLL